MSDIVTKRGKQYAVGLYHAAQFVAAELSKHAPGTLDRTVADDPRAQIFGVDVLPDTTEPGRVLFGVSMLRAASRSLATALRDIRGRRYGSLDLPQATAIERERGYSPQAEVRGVMMLHFDNPTSPYFGHVVARFDVMVVGDRK